MNFHLFQKESASALIDFSIVLQKIFVNRAIQSVLTVLIIQRSAASVVHQTHHYLELNAFATKASFGMRKILSAKNVMVFVPTAFQKILVINVNQIVTFIMELAIV
jgi:hypothetical protein